MCRSISKVVLVVVNLVFGIFSLACVALGIFVAVDRGRVVNQMGKAPQDSDIKSLANRDQLMTAAIVFIVLSFLCLLLCISGCVGAVKENTCLLATYSGVMTLLLLVELAALGLAIAYKGRLQDDLTRVMLKADKELFQPYNSVTANQSSQGLATKILSHIHVAMSCCGTNNYTDITQNSSWSRANSTYKGQPLVVPVSCCKLTDQGVNYFKDHDDFDNFHKYLINGSHCPTKLADFHQEACLPKLLDDLRGNVMAIIITSLIYVLFNVVCIVMAFCLIRKYKSRQRQGL